MTSLLAGAAMGAAFMLVNAEARGMGRLKVASKLVASTFFLLCALAGGALAGGPAGLLVLLGLALSFVGDACLLSRERRWFLGGLGAFLLAHVAYVAAFLVLGLSPVGVAVAAVPLLGLFLAVWRWLSPFVGRLRRPVLAYIVVITVMVAFAAGALVDAPSGVRFRLLFGAVLFYISDLAVARDRFVAPGPANKAWGIPLYYLAQVNFATAAGSLAD